MPYRPPRTDGSGDTATVHALTARTIDGVARSLGDHAGGPMRIVNAASKCGFPRNQFGNQGPGDAAGIASFGSLTYDVRFAMFAKMDVDGTHAHPLFR